MNNLPDLGGILQQMKARDKLYEVSDQSILGFSIQVALKNKRPNREIFKTIMESYRDNSDAVLDLIGIDTINLIKSIYKP